MKGDSRRYPFFFFGIYHFHNGYFNTIMPYLSAKTIL
jgi:hypothetical protein